MAAKEAGNTGDEDAVGHAGSLARVKIASAKVGRVALGSSPREKEGS
jgi:hypothetical protein